MIHLLLYCGTALAWTSSLVCYWLLHKEEDTCARAHTNTHTPDYRCWCHLLLAPPRWERSVSLSPDCPDVNFCLQSSPPDHLDWDTESGSLPSAPQDALDCSCVQRDNTNLEMYSIMLLCCVAGLFDITLKDDIAWPWTETFQLEAQSAFRYWPILFTFCCLFAPDQDDTGWMDTSSYWRNGKIEGWRMNEGERND